MELKPLALGDKAVFDRYLGKRRHELAQYSFPNIYCWKKLFTIRWGILKGALCVFFQDAMGCFLYLPPLGIPPDPAVIEPCFGIMDAVNKNRRISRIENAEEDDVEGFTALGYPHALKSHDFIYSRPALAALRGDPLKAKRAAVNRFIRANRFSCGPYLPAHKEECLSLYKEWMRGRGETTPEPVYRGMLSDSLNSLEVILDDFSSLDMTGLVVQVGGAIRAFTLGCRMNDDTLCVLFETADLGIKGLSQFIFREFCARHEGFCFVNAMDDSGLDNLKRVKMSYRPRKLAAAYIINRADEA